MISDVKKFMQAAEQTTDSFNVRQTALYIGLQCEELAEKLEAILGPDNSLVQLLNIESMLLKEGDRNTRVARAGAHELLDADIDLMWVTIGSVLSQGADIDGAIAEVTRSNMSKLVDGKMVKDANGKVTKPSHFSPPNLEPFVR